MLKLPICISLPRFYSLNITDEPNYPIPLEDGGALSY